MSKVLRALEADHRNAVHLLELLSGEIEVLARSDRRPNYDLMHATLDYFLDHPDLGHHPMEDVVYRLLRRRAPEATERIRDLIEDHRQLSELTRSLAGTVATIRADIPVPRDYLVTPGRQLVDRYRDHIRREEAEFFPAARRHLTFEDWGIVDAEFDLPTDPLFGPSARDRFRRLRAEIDNLAHEAR